MTVQASPPPRPGTPAGRSAGIDLGPTLALCGLANVKVGAKLSDNVRRAAANNSRLRILRPGDMATMDFVQDRINLIVDSEGYIVDIKCG